MDTVTLVIVLSHCLNPNYGPIPMLILQSVYQCHLEKEKVGEGRSNSTVRTVIGSSPSS
jgi:hypothetical protein